MADEAWREASQVQAQRMAAMGKLAAGVAHEINNPVGVLMMKLKFLLSIADAEGLSERALSTLGVAVEQTERIERIVEQLVSFSRPVEGVPRRLRLHDELTRILAALRQRHAAPGIDWIWQPAARVPDVYADPAELERIVGSLVDNAVDAAGPEGSIVVATHDGTAEGSAGVRIEVGDDGPGIPADFIEHIYDPFFTAKKVGEGTGLGLAIAYNLVRLRGGSIRAASVRGAGTTMTVTLPAAQGQP